VTRKPDVRFNPQQVIELVRLGTAPACRSQFDREHIVAAYIEVSAASICLFCSV